MFSQRPDSDPASPPAEEADMLNRREFIGASLGVGAAVAAASVVAPSDVRARLSHRTARPCQSGHAFREHQFPLGAPSRHRVGAQTDGRAGTAGHRAIREQTMRSIGTIRWRSRSSSMMRASRSSTRPTARPASRQTSSIRIRSEDHRRSCGVCARFSPAARRRPLEVQYGRAAARRSERRSTEETRQHPQARSAGKRLPWG